MTAPNWHAVTPDRNLGFRSHECKRGDDGQCHGYFDTSGSACGYDTYVCLCACHNETRGAGQ